MRGYTADAKVKRRVRLWRLLGWTLVVAAIVVVSDYLFYPYGTAMPGRSGNQSGNGLWLRDTWYFGEADQSQIHQLHQRLREEQIAYAYCHVRGIQRDGTLAYHFPLSAQKLVAEIHQHDPGIKVIAWVYAGNARGKGPVDLSRSSVRQTMAAQARWLTTTGGFDGVQWDYEVCSNGDVNFLRLLQETRAAMPPGKVLSVATPLWLPKPFTSWGWSSGYYQRVARDCDQIAVMGYDSGVYLPRAYVWLMAQQVNVVSQAVGRGNPECRLLIGIPTYRDGGFSHDPHVENMNMALRGIEEGLDEPGTDRRVFSGIAIFADYTTTADDWQYYRQWWLNQ